MNPAKSTIGHPDIRRAEKVGTSETTLKARHWRSAEVCVCVWRMVEFQSFVADGDLTVPLPPAESHLD